MLVRHYTLAAKNNVAGILHYISNQPTLVPLLLGTARFLCDLEVQRALRRIPSAVRALQSPESF